MRNAVGDAGEEEWREATAGIRRRSVFLWTVNATALGLLVTDNIDQTRQMWIQKWHEGVPDHHSRHEVEGSLLQVYGERSWKERSDFYHSGSYSRLVALHGDSHKSCCFTLTRQCFRASSWIKSKINNHSLPFRDSSTGGERKTNHEEKKMCHCKFIKNSWCSTRCAHLPLTNWHLCSRCA